MSAVPYWASSDGDVTLYLGDCLDVLRTLEADSIDAIVTDPPAGIAFMGRDWDDFRRARWRFTEWLTERMVEALRVLKPGGHLLVWSLPRTSHWTAWALEDAGLEIRDCILHLFGSGFPKSLDVSKAIDKAGGQAVSWFGPWLRQERERRGISSHELCERGGFYKNVNHGGLVVNWELGLGIPTAAQFNKVCEILDLDYPRIEVLEREVIAQGYRIRRESTVQIAGCSDGEYDITAPATDAGKQWAGFGTALKPGQEMWWLARKPLKGTVAASVLEFGTGALNIDGCKVGTEQRVNNAGGSSSLQRVSRVEAGYRPTVTTSRNEDSEVTGRWPANVVFTHSASCDGVCAPDCPAGELDRQSGDRRSAYPGRPNLAAAYVGTQLSEDGRTCYGHGFDRASSPSYSDSGGASRFYPVFRYQAKAPASERPRLEDGTAHETVKPLGFISWAVRLITPPGGTVLDLFAGSGPVAEACIIEGFRCVLIEQDPKSARLIRKRLGKPIQPVIFGLDA